MQKPPLDPDVVDIAPPMPSWPKSTSSRICVCSTRMRKVLTGAKPHE